MNSTDLKIIIIAITLVVMALIIGAGKELEQKHDKKIITTSTTTYHLSIEKLTIKKVGE